MTVQQALDILGVNVDATDDDIRQAYRDLVAVWHPDRYAGNERLRRKAESKLKDVNAAYELLREDGWRTASYTQSAYSDPEEADDEYEFEPEPEPAGNESGVAIPVNSARWSGLRRFAAPAILLIALVLPIGFALREALLPETPGVSATAPTTDNAADNYASNSTADETSQPSTYENLPVKETYPTIIRMPNGDEVEVNFETEPTEAMIREAAKNIVKENPQFAALAPPAKKNQLESEPRITAQQPTAEPHASREASGDSTSFTLGSSEEHVLSVQGTPKSIDDYGSRKNFWYGSAHVTFKDGIVVDYDNDYSGTLKVRVAPRTRSALRHFTLGSTEDEVLSVQGTPKSIDDYGSRKTYWYGSAHVTFKDGIVVDYDNDYSGTLKVKL